MLTIRDRSARLCDGLTRRDWLQVGGASALGLSLPSLLAARQPGALTAHPAQAAGKAKSCILLFLLGGPPQHETWDPKPDAPAEIRGDFRPIATKTPGVTAGELMPLTARLTDKIAVLRAVASNDNAHSSSGYWMLTGSPHAPMNMENAKPGAPNDCPSLGAVVNYLRHGKGGLPNAVTLPEHIWNTGMIPWPGQDAGFLGHKHDPWLLFCDPSQKGFQIPGLGLPPDIPPLRFDDRHSLLSQVNRHLDAVERGSAFIQHETHRQQAFDLLRSSKSRQAFDLDREPPALRERYGMHRFGQSLLLARRLVEAGVSLVQVNWTRDKEGNDESPAWDTHGKNTYYLKNWLMPPMDRAYSALLEDLSARGLLDETLVVWMGEFGRTPKINARGGRDHWGFVYSTALAGGGIRGGQVYGSSDRIGAFPKDGRVQPSDIAATIFHSLGFAPDTEVRDTQGRPLVISKGEVIRQIL